MRTLYCTILFFCILSCNNGNETKIAPVTDSLSHDSISTRAKIDTELNYVHIFSDSVLENKITSALMKLPFVKKSNTYIDSFSNHRHGIAFMLDSMEKGETEIPVRAGYNGNMRFETYYFFYVNPKTLEIKVMDVVNDKKMSVKEYIKSQH